MEDIKITKNEGIKKWAKKWAKERAKEWKNFLSEEEGIGVVEVILILVVLIGLVVIFKEELTTLINGIFETITERAGKI